MGLRKWIDSTAPIWQDGQDDFECLFTEESCTMWLPFLRKALQPLLHPSRRSSLLCRSRTFQPRLEFLEDRTLLSTTKWTGLGTDTNWSTPRNWSNGVPGPGDAALFDSSAGSHLSATVDAGFAWAVDTLNLTWSGTLTVASPLSVGHDLTLSNGTLTGNSDVTVNGTLTW